MIGQLVSSEMPAACTHICLLESCAVVFSHTDCPYSAGVSVVPSLDPPLEVAFSFLANE